MRNFKLVIEYDGTAYCGWQRQANAPTIQATIEAVLQIMTKRPVTLIGSGRTDSGVHALKQTANFRCETKLSASIFLRGLNSLLPSDIVIKDCQEADESFHSRFDAISKTYDYHILNRAIPAAIRRQYAWHIRQPLDIHAMRIASEFLLGTHDFSAFEATGSPRAHSVRTIMNVCITTDGCDRDHLVVSIEANGFLRCMVRNIVGSLVRIGLHRTHVETLKTILASRDRQLAAAPAPAHGLFLREVTYTFP